MTANKVNNPTTLYIKIPDGFVSRYRSEVWEFVINEKIDSWVEEQTGNEFWKIISHDIDDLDIHVLKFSDGHGGFDLRVAVTFGEQYKFISDLFCIQFAEIICTMPDLDPEAVWPFKNEKK